MFLDLLLFLAIGLIAGWFAGLLLRGRRLAWRTNLVAGLLGAMVGGGVLPLLGLSARGLIGELLLATVGATCVLLAVSLSLMKRTDARRA